jgi:hypothetical protein
MAFPIGVQMLPGYPMPVGEKYLLVFDRVGPTSYTQFNTGTGAGGDVLSLVTGCGLNIGGFEYVDADACDTTGRIQVFPVFTRGGTGNTVGQVSLMYFSLVTATIGGQAQTAGSQIVAGTNLSTISFRMRALGI